MPTIVAEQPANTGRGSTRWVLTVLHEPFHQSCSTPSTSQPAVVPGRRTPAGDPKALAHAVADAHGLLRAVQSAEGDRYLPGMWWYNRRPHGRGALSDLPARRGAADRRTALPTGRVITVALH